MTWVAAPGALSTDILRSSSAAAAPGLAIKPAGRVRSAIAVKVRRVNIVASVVVRRPGQLRD
jgi:hypothetical protein